MLFVGMLMLLFWLIGGVFFEKRGEKRVKGGILSLFKLQVLFKRNRKVK